MLKENYCLCLLKDDSIYWFDVPYFNVTVITTIKIEILIWNFTKAELKVKNRGN